MSYFTAFAVFLGDSFGSAFTFFGAFSTLAGTCGVAFTRVWTRFRWAIRGLPVFLSYTTSGKAVFLLARRFPVRLVECLRFGVGAMRDIVL